MKNSSSVFVLLSLCFLEGAAIMCLQLCAGSMLAPYFGNTLQTWAVLMGIVFTAFASGYYSAALRKLNHLGYMLAGAGVYLLLMTRLASRVPALLNLGAVGGMFAAAVLLLLVPVALLSTIPIRVTAHLSERKGTAGYHNGLAFFVSTLGGITASFATGFYLIPNYGPLFLIKALGFFLFVPGLAAAVRSSGGVIRLILLAIAAVVTIIVLFVSAEQPELVNKKVLHVSNGILGQLIVADDTIDNKRILYMNGSAQAQAELTDTTSSSYAYVRDLITATPTITSGKRVLLLGMGGGYLAGYYAGKGAEVDLVELDARIPQLAEQYFMPSQLQATVHIDDARHFVNTAPANNQYDLVVIDVYTGDNAPFHIITKEAFSKMRAILKPQGTLCVFFPYSLDEQMMLAHARMFNTLETAGFATEDGSNATGRLLVFAHKKETVSTPNKQDVFSDNKPQLELFLKHQHEMLNSLRKKLWQRKS